ERRIPIEVIRGDVEEHRRLWTKSADALELERRDFDDRDPRSADACIAVRDRASQRRPEISADKNRLSRRLHESAAKLGGRALAVRSTDRDDRSLDEPTGELDLGDDAH